MHPLSKTEYNKFVFDDDEADYKLKDAPSGYDEIEQNIIRSKTNDGMVFDVVQNLKFTGLDKDKLISRYLNKGAKQTVTFSGKKRIGNDLIQTQLGVFDFKTSVWDKTSFTADLKSTKFDEIFRANQKEKFELDRTTDINGNTIPALERKAMVWKQRKMLIYADFNEEEYSNSFSLDVVLTPLMTANPSSDDDMFSVYDPFVVDPSGGTDVWTSNMFMFNSSRNKEIIIDYDFDIEVSVYNSVNVAIYKYNNEQSLDYVSATDIVPAFTTSGANVTASGTITVEVLEGESLMLGFFIDSGASYSVNVNKCYLHTEEHFLYTPKFNHEKYVDCISMYDALERMIMIIDPTVEFKSDYIKNNWEGLVVTGGESVRHILYDGVQAPLLTTSFNALFETMFTIAPVSFRIRKSGNRVIFEVEHISDFYRNTEDIHLGKLQNIEYSTEVDKLYNRIEIGYRNSGAIEDLNGLLTTHTQNTFTLPVDDGENTYTATTEARADPYEAQDCYIKQFSQFPDTDTPYDKDMFVFDCLKSSLSFVTVYVPYQYQEHFSAVSGFYEPQTGYNYRLTPMNCLLRHPVNFKHEYNLKAYEDDKVRYTSTNGNVNVSTTLTGGVERFENEDLRIGDLEDGLLVPIKVTGNAVLTEAVLNEINGGGDTQNIYATATFEDDRGYEIRCHLYELTIKDDIQVEAILKNG